MVGSRRCGRRRRARSRRSTSIRKSRKINVILCAMMRHSANVQPLGPKGDNETPFIAFNIEGEVYHHLIRSTVFEIKIATDVWYKYL
jgi:hypothetical protein